MRPTTRQLVAGTPARTQRALWLVAVALAATVLAVAGWLTPNPSGYGTHTQLGLPPCGFFYLTHLPCPGCGLTTSFAYMARLQVVDALAAHPLGVVLYAATALMIPIGVVGCARGWEINDTLARLRMDRVVIGLASLALALWLIRLARILAAQ